MPRATPRAPRGIPRRMRRALSGFFRAAGGATLSCGALLIRDERGKPYAIGRAEERKVSARGKGGQNGGSAGAIVSVASSDRGGRTTVTVQSAPATTAWETPPRMLRLNEFVRAPITM